MANAVLDWLPALASTRAGVLYALGAGEAAASSASARGVGGQTRRAARKARLGAPCGAAVETGAPRLLAARAGMGSPCVDRMGERVEWGSGSRGRVGPS